MHGRRYQAAYPAKFLSALYFCQKLTEGIATMNQNKEADRPERVHEDQRWINFEDKLKRWGTGFLIIFILSGMAGVFSKGYFSEGRAGDGTTQIIYERFGRVLSSMDMKITYVSSGTEMSRISLGRDFMENYEVLTLHPQPFRAFSDGRKLILEYHLLIPARQQTIWLGLQPRKAGAGRTFVTVDGNKPLSFFQLVYP